MRHSSPPAVLERAASEVACALVVMASCREGAPMARDAAPELVSSETSSPVGSPPGAVDSGRLPPLKDPWFDRTTLGDGSDVALAIPSGATEARPIVVGIHGALDHHDWACSEWYASTRGRAFVVCPRGAPRADGSAAWTSAAQIAERADAAVALVRARFGPYVGDGPLLYGGWSQGATLASAVVASRPGVYGEVILVEAGHTPLSADRVVADLRRGKVERVAVACSTSSCRAFSKRMEEACSRAAFPFAADDVGLRGHVFDSPMYEAISKRLAWLTAGDARWGER